MRYEITSFDVCQPGFERLRNRDEFLLVADVGRRTSKKALREQFFDDIQACERPDGFDYDACRDAVATFVKRVDMSAALLYAEAGCQAFLYVRDTADGAYTVLPMNEPDGEGNGWTPCDPANATAWHVEDEDGTAVAAFDTQAEADAWAKANA